MENARRPRTRVRNGYALRTMAWMPTRVLRKTRMFALIAFVALGFVIATTTTREKGWHFGNGWFISVANATLQAGHHQARLLEYEPKPPGPYTKGAWNPDYAFAWRPFHARGMYGGPAAGAAPIIDWQFVVLPLWPFALLSLAACMYSHGRLTMLRDVRSSACHNCGYPSPTRSSCTGPCPECGTTRIQARDLSEADEQVLQSRVPVVH